MSMINSSETIGNRTRDLPDCSAVPQPTAPPATCPIYTKTILHYNNTAETRNSAHCRPFCNLVYECGWILILSLLFLNGMKNAKIPKKGVGNRTFRGRGERVALSRLIYSLSLIF